VWIIELYFLIELSEQVPEDGWTDERHSRRGSGQGGQRAGAHSRAERGTEQQKSHGVKQHHPIQNRGILRPEIVVPGRHKAEQEGDDHRKKRAQNRG
jgi:hypothetical protein